MQRNTMRCWAEISLDSLKHNYALLRRQIPQECKLMGVVKANAYGHGAGSIGRELVDMGAEYLGVACLNEAIELRLAGITAPILILGYTETTFAEDLHLYQLTQTVYDLESARTLSQWATEHHVKLRVHIKVDTGMSRLGLLVTEETQAQVVQTIQEIHALPGLYFEGIFTHLSSPDCDDAYTLMQLRRFTQLLIALHEVDITFAIRHCESSAAVLNYPWMQIAGERGVQFERELAMNMVRSGIALFGHGSDYEFDPIEHGFQPVMRLFARVAQVNDFPAGSRVSYGGIYELTRPSKLATISIGYADGYSRALSNRHHVMIQGRPAPILGRICMDMCMVDVTEIPDVKVGGAAEIFGDHLPLEIAAKALDTIPYELLCAVSPRVTRVYR